jgi:hypothetical protein
MTLLKSLKLVSATKINLADKLQNKRRKLAEQIQQQIEIATAEMKNESYVAYTTKSVRDDETGDIKKVSIEKRLRTWYWITTKGTLQLSIKYGSKTLLLDAKSKLNAVECADLNAVVDALKLIKDAVLNGDLDEELSAASVQLRKGFNRN